MFFQDLVQPRTSPPKICKKNSKNAFFENDFSKNAFFVNAFFVNAFTKNAFQVQRGGGRILWGVGSYGCRRGDAEGEGGAHVPLDRGERLGFRRRARVRSGRLS